MFCKQKHSTLWRTESPHSNVSNIIEQSYPAKTAILLNHLWGNNLANNLCNCFVHSQIYDHFPIFSLIHTQLHLRVIKRKNNNNNHIQANNTENLSLFKLKLQVLIGKPFTVPEMQNEALGIFQRKLRGLRKQFFAFYKNDKKFKFRKTLYCKWNKSYRGIKYHYFSHYFRLWWITRKNN